MYFQPQRWQVDTQLLEIQPEPSIANPSAPD